MSLLHDSLCPPGHVPQENHNDMMEDIDPKTAALIAQFALDDLGYIESEKKEGPSSGDNLHSSSFAAALIADAAYLEAIMIAEEAAVQDRIAAEMLARGEALPPSTAAQRRLENPSFVMEPDVPAAAVVVLDAMQNLADKFSDTTSNVDQLPPYVAEEIPLAGTKGKARAIEDIPVITPAPDFQAPPFNPHDAYLEAIIIAEEAAMQDRLAAEILSRGGELPPQTAAQKRMEGLMFSEPLTSSVTLVPPAAQQLQIPPIIHADIFDAAFTVPPKDTDTDSDFYKSILDSFQKPRSLAKSDYLPLTPGPSVNRNRWVQCTICYDSLLYDKAFQTPCDHNYCSTCIVTLVEKSTLDESLFPPRCCGKPITMASVDSYISPTLRSTVQDKYAEFGTPAKDRVYCFQPTCTTFLGSSEAVTGTGIVCPICRRSTCPRCKQAEHLDEDCITSEATLQLRALAKSQRWQICPGCHFVVELNGGCYHMSCRCGTQFCYQCAAVWKTCSC